jgi:hypothetical protein
LTLDAVRSIDNPTELNLNFGDQSAGGSHRDTNRHCIERVKVAAHDGPPFAAP